MVNKANPDRRGYDLGRKARRDGKPEPRHFDKDGKPRSPGWIEWMRRGYFGGNKRGAPKLDQDKVNVTCRIDLTLRDKAIALDIQRSAALSMALRVLTSTKVEELAEVFTEEIASITVFEDEVVIVDHSGISYSGKTKLEALLVLLTT